MRKFGLYTPSETADLLREIRRVPIKKLGQNFLVDPNIVRKSIDFADICASDTVVEIGPGLGTLTGALIRSGAVVYAVEFDKALFSFLAGCFDSSPNFNLINADALDFPLAGLPDDVEDFKIVANLPYSISTAWLDAVLCGRLPTAMSLMLQKEAALRFTSKAGTKNFSSITICLMETYDIINIHKVSSACFYPRPRVDSVLLAMRRKTNPYIFDPATKKLMRAVFSKRRKQIGRIAKDAGGDSKILLSWIEKLNFSGISADRRPETLPPSVWKLLDCMVKTELQ